MVKPKKNNWKTVEQLVALIEQTIDESAAEVKWNYSVPDLHSGEPRQIDIAIKSKAGSVNMLVAIECRDRSRPAGSPWIEELNGKQSSIGASKMVAVSTSGFTKPALKKAEAYGIDTRRIDQISVSDIEGWSEFQGISFLLQTFNVISVKLCINESSEHDTFESYFDHAYSEGLRNNCSEHVIGHEEPGNHPIILGRVIKHAAQNGGIPCNPNPANGDIEKFAMTFHPESDKQWLVESKRGLVEIQQIQALIHFNYETYSKDHTELIATKYAVGKKNLASSFGAEFKTNSGTHKIDTVVSANGKSVMYISKTPK